MMATRQLRWVLPLLLVSVHPRGAAAQQTANTLHPGDDVRVHAPALRSSRVRGTVVLYQGATLDVRERQTGAIVSIPIESIRMLARNEGIDRGRSSWRMARFGGFIGAAGGLVAGPLIATSHAPKRFGEVMLASGLVGTLGGAAIGAVLGSAFAHDQWQRFRMPIVPTFTAASQSLRLEFTAALP